MANRSGPGFGGIAGTLLVFVLAIAGGLVWMLMDFGIVSANSARGITYVVEVCTALMLALGMRRSRICRGRAPARWTSIGRTDDSSRRGANSRIVRISEEQNCCAAPCGPQIRRPMKQLPWLVQPGPSIAACIAAGFVWRSSSEFLTIWVTGHGYAFILGDAPIREPGGLHSRLGGLAMVMTAEACGIVTWRQLGRDG